MTREEFQRQALRDQRRAQLIGEYQKFMAEHGLSLGSADEHVFDDDLKPELRDWLRAFCNRWDQNERGEA